MFGLSRVRSCICKTMPDTLLTPNTNKHIVCCPKCMLATHQHAKLTDAMTEWNYSGSSIWRNFDMTLRVRFMRWWHGRFL